MRRFRLAGQVIDETDSGLQSILANAYDLRIRPLCLCREPGLAMYIARVGTQYVVKRMPLSGSGHDPQCPSYEAPDELSGLGVLMGSAIQVDPETGISALKVSFTLTKTGSRPTPVSSSGGTEDVSGDPKKLSLRSLLHYLWHQAELTEWTSRWQGKRHWWNIRWHLIEAARQMVVKGGTLADVMFVPESFRATDKAAIEQRRAAELAPSVASTRGPRRLMILVGEVKEIIPARSGHRLIIKHMPGFPFMLDDSLHRRLQVRYENELALWAADDASHLMIIATFGLSSAGLASAEELALMVVAENWVPYESLYEKKLVDVLAKVKLRSVKGLRYNLPIDLPFAAAWLQRHPVPLAMYVVPPSADKVYEEALGELIASRPEVDAWVWRTVEGDMPPLPFR